jgi:serine/threonine protein phosphatase PrpC
MQLPISLGNQGFASLRENHCFYIDKTDFIREWWEEQDVVTLIKYKKDTKLVVNHLVSFFAL